MDRTVVKKRRVRFDPLRDTYNRMLRIQIRCHQLGINAAEFQIAEQDGDRVPGFVQCEEGPSRARGRNKKLYTS